MRTLQNCVNILAQTDDQAEERIRERMMDTITLFHEAGPDAIERRLSELDHEWDLDRSLEYHSAIAIFLGLAVGMTIRRRWLVWPALAGGFLLQHSLQRSSLPVAILRRLGVRTAREIEHERLALKTLRGDFHHLAQMIDSDAQNAKKRMEQEGGSGDGSDSTEEHARETVARVLRAIGQ